MGTVLVNDIEFETEKNHPFGQIWTPMSEEKINVNAWIRKDPESVLNLLMWISMIVMRNVTKRYIGSDGSHAFGTQKKPMKHTRIIHPDANGKPHIVCWYPKTYLRSAMVLTQARTVPKAIYQCREMIDDLHVGLYSGRAPAYLRKLRREIEQGPDHIDPRRLVQIGREPIHTLRKKKIEICQGDRAFS